MEHDSFRELIQKLHDIDQCLAHIQDVGTLCIDSKLNQEFCDIYRVKKYAVALRCEIERLLNEYWKKNDPKILRRDPNSNI